MRLGVPIAGLSKRWAVALVVSLIVPIANADVAVTEAELKTAYLMNIARFAQWPSSDHIAMCVFDSSSIYQQVRGLDNAQIADGRRIKIRVNPSEPSECQLLYWDNASMLGKSAIRDALDFPGMLVVSDVANALDRGAVIQFFLRGNKLRFSINAELLKKADYKVSSKLLRLARRLD